MTHEIILERLDDWATGDLPAPERAEVDLHLAGCSDCRAEAEALKTLLAEVDDLPAEILPGRDLWAGIAARLEPGGETVTEVAPLARRRTWAPRWAMQAAAAVALMVSGAAIGRQMDGPGIPADPGKTPPTDDRAARRKPTSAFVAFQRDGAPEYETAIAELETILERNRSRLAPQTVQTLEANLAIIDEAIRQSREALARDPNSPELARMLAGAYDQKLTVLQRAVTL